jgi:hypothetical protein
VSKEVEIHETMVQLQHLEGENDNFKKENSKLMILNDKTLQRKMDDQKKQIGINREKKPSAVKSEKESNDSDVTGKEISSSVLAAELSLPAELPFSARVQVMDENNPLIEVSAIASVPQLAPYFVNFSSKETHASHDHSVSSFLSLRLMCRATLQGTTSHPLACFQSLNSARMSTIWWKLLTSKKQARVFSIFILQFHHHIRYLPLTAEIILSP